MDILENAHIPALSQIIHIKMVHILHLVPPFLLDAQVLGDHNPHIVVLLVEALGQGAHNVCQTSCLNERYCLRCHK